MKFSKKELLTDIIFDILGAACYSFGINCFAKPARFATSGLDGFSLIINYLTGLPIGLTTFCINLPMIIFSFKLLGKKFMFRTFKSIVIMSCTIDMLVPYIPQYHGDRLIAAIFAGVFVGIGLTSFYIRGGSTGGIDFITMSIRKIKPHLQIGSISRVINFFILCFAVYAFRDIDAALYGAIEIFVSSTIIDKAMYGTGAGKMLLIVTTKASEIAAEIHNATHRGSSIVDIKGAYSNEDKQLLLSACNKNQVFAARRTAYSIDPDCFVMVSSTDEVFGKGFMLHDPQ